MKPGKYILITLLLIPNLLLAQYFTINLGITHHLLTPQPLKPNGLFLSTPNGPQQLEPTYKQFIFSYNPGYNLEFLFNLDWANNNGGFIFGIKSQSLTDSYIFYSTPGNYQLTQNLTFFSAAIPVLIKLGPDIYRNQSYFFFGANAMFNVIMKIKEKVSFNSQSKSIYTSKGITPFIIYGSIGLNLRYFRLEFSILPMPLLNPKYSVNVGTNDAPFYINPYENYPKWDMWITTSFSIPLIQRYY